MHNVYDCMGLSFEIPLTTGGNFCGCRNENLIRKFDRNGNENGYSVGIGNGNGNGNYCYSGMRGNEYQNLFQQTSTFHASATHTHRLREREREREREKGERKLV